MSLFTPTWYTEKAGANALASEPGKPEKAFSGLIGEESRDICPRISPGLHPCVSCHAETEPEDLFCPACWEKRLALMPQDVTERRRRLDHARREKRVGLLATSPYSARTATSPARSIPPGSSPEGSAG